ncbi:hypothetical protein BX600DRAFT_519135 [Xylariales sp. PMI_506]|nr:hypothetical protein BX600DRAFT_519135 [Xylariales sp. PMI_506]
MNVDQEPPVRAKGVPAGKETQPLDGHETARQAVPAADLVTALLDEDVERCRQLLHISPLLANSRFWNIIFTSRSDSPWGILDKLSTMKPSVIFLSQILSPDDVNLRGKSGTLFLNLGANLKLVNGDGSAPLYLVTRRPNWVFLATYEPEEYATWIRRALRIRELLPADSTNSAVINREGKTAVEIGEAEAKVIKGR